MFYVTNHNHFFIANDNILNQNNKLHISFRLFLLHPKILVANTTLTEHK